MPVTVLEKQPDGLAKPSSHEGVSGHRVPGHPTVPFLLQGLVGRPRPADRWLQKPGV